MELIKEKTTRNKFKNKVKVAPYAYIKVPLKLSR